MSETPDRVLVERTRRGEVEAFSGLVDRHRRRVFSVAYRMLGDREEATDVAQEAFVRAYERLESFQASGSFIGWILSITSNLCIDIRRRRKHTTSSLEQAAEDKGFEPESTDVAPDRKVEAEDTASAIEDAISQLPPAQRLAITLRHIEGLGYQAISRVMGIPVGTAKTHVHRGRERLARKLSRFYPEVTS